MKILLVEDNEYNALMLAKALKTYNYQTETVKDGQSGLELAKAFEYDLLLLDVMLPKLDGISLCRQLRTEGYHTPILMLTANDSCSLRVQGIEAGADDYLIKPFEMPELVARMRAILRRGREFLPEILSWENLHLDTKSREVTCNGKRLHLTPKEYGLLELFLRYPRRIFSRTVLLDSVWLSSESPGEEAVTTQIKGLRHKLKVAGITADLIETVYGAGYRLREEGKTTRKQQAGEGTIISSLSSSSTLSANMEVMAAVSKAWEEFKETLGERLELFERVLAGLSTGTADSELLKQAQAEAHCLAGSLGCYGLPMGSKVAREMEFLLQTLIAWRQNATLVLTRLAKLTLWLKETLQQPCEEEDKQRILAKKVLAAKYPIIIQQVENQGKRKPNTKPKHQFTDQHIAELEVTALMTRTTQEFQLSLDERLDLFEQVLTHLLRGNPDSQLLQEAQTEAHRIANSFGNRMPSVTKIAREMEFLLQSSANLREHTALLLNRLEKLTIWLKETLEQPPTPATVTIRKVSSKRLLIIDYDTVLTERIKQEAVALGLQVEVATDLTMAKNILALYPPDVILLDISLGNTQQNGLTLLAQLSTKKSKIPVIVFTASNHFHYRVEAARLGAHTFLHKTTAVDEVLSIVNSLLNQSPTTKAKILVVDDDPLVLEYITKLLLSWEFQITTLQNPQQFWQALEATTPDLLILDIQMPDFSGIELCQVVRNDRRWSWIPIVFLSVHSDEKTRQQVYAVGADDYVQKPIVEHELMTRVLNRLARGKFKE